MLDLAARMIQAFDVDSTATRGEIDEALEPIVASCPDKRLANGLRKTLEDRAEFTSPNSIDYAANRRKLFLASAKVLRSGTFSDEEEYRAMVDGMGWDKTSGSIYADLPVNDRLVSTRGILPRELLQRYNTGIVQALLLQADSLDLHFDNASLSKLRRLFSSIRFHRLVAEASYCAPSGVKKVPANPGDVEKSVSINMHIDGPGSVLAQPRSYGFQLATFFPNVCAMDKWKLTARVMWKDAPRQLKLDESSGLVCFNQRGAFCPEEIGIFIKNFKDNAAGWSVDDETPFMKGSGGMLIFPDFAFTDAFGHKVYLELFHRWHSTQLTARLDEMDAGAERRLIIGVDRAVAERPGIKERLDSSKFFAENGFLYRDYPGVEKVLKALNSFLK